MTLRNQHVRPENLFFEDHPISTGKAVRILVKTFFFGDHLFLIAKTVRISVKTFFFMWRSPDFGKAPPFFLISKFGQNCGAFSLSVLEFTKPEIRHI